MVEPVLAPALPDVPASNGTSQRYGVLAATLAELLHSTLDARLVLEPVLDRLTEGMNADLALLRLRDDVTGQLRIEAAVRLDDVTRAELSVADRWNAIDAAVKRAPLVMNDPGGSRIPESLTVRGIYTLLAAPLFAHGEFLGMLCLGGRGGITFSEAELDAAGAIADHLAVAIANARLYSVVKRGRSEWEQTADAITDTIAVFDANCRVMRGNAALADHCGRHVTMLKGLSCDEIGFCSAGVTECVVKRAIAAGETNRAEVTLPNGEIYLVTTLPITDSRSAGAAVQIAKNVTAEVHHARALAHMTEQLGITNMRLMEALEQLKSMQARLIQTEKLSSLGRLVAGAAHELNNPLASVTGYTQLLVDDLQEHLSEGDWVAGAHRDVTRIASEARRAAKIVSNLLAFARQQSAERVPQNISELVARVLTLREYELRRDKVAVTTDFAPDLPPVTANAGQIQEVVLNLLLNAGQALKKKSEGRELHVAVRFEPRSCSVVIEIRDNGHGIAAEHLHHVFDPFFTTRQVGEGSGLGLSVSYGVVRDHGGDISAESEPAVRTTFSVRLPALTDTAQRLTALVAHADGSIASTLTATLTGWGHRVVASGESDARAAVERDRPDLILLDRTVLGANLPGWRALCAAMPDKVRFLFLGPDADADGRIQTFLHEHVGASVLPPYDLAALHQAIRAAMEHSR